MNLRKIRVTVAVIFFALITLLFLDFTGTVHTWFGWLAKIQFLPALLALHVGVILALIILTLIFGRVYCSVICPLGVFQDVVSRVAGARRRFRFRYSKALTALRLTFLVIFVGAIVAGLASVVAILEPYSAFGRIVSNLFAPLWQWGNNLLAYLAERADSYAFYSTEVWIRSIPTFVVAVGSLILVVVLAWRGGRTYCNTVCPVGTVLGYLSKFSFIKMRIDTEKCNSCGLCVRSCKSSCIDTKSKKIDYTRCVTCFDCLDKCRRGAIYYSRKARVSTDTAAANNAKTATQTDESTVPMTSQTDESTVPMTSFVENPDRRKFIATTSLLLAASVVKAQETKVDGGLSVIIDKKIPDRQTPIVPSGSRSEDNFNSKCTACQLCVSVCPNGVLRPSTSLAKFMQPEMSYERGYCRPECTKCSEVCPSGAINLVTRAEKSSISIGTAHWISKNCVVTTDGVSCGNCAANCPVGAIQMIDSDYGNKIPAINVERCIGCGACEYVCPAAPYSAIYVEGNSRHREI